MSRKTGSKQRVEKFALKFGVPISILEMPESTRTAEEAAVACGCHVEQIVKSLIFQGSLTEDLYLLLVSGINRVDVEAVSSIVGESLERADPKNIRSKTGFAIGGVAPFGSLEKLPTWIDRHLLSLPTVWAAAGAPNAVFEINTDTLVTLTKAEPISLTV